MAIQFYGIISLFEADVRCWVTSDWFFVQMLILLVPLWFVFFAINLTVYVCVYRSLAEKDE